MIRPQSIVRYEQLYWSSFVLGLIASAFTWSTRAAALAANPGIAGQTWLLWATLIVGILISLSLWYFTARAPNVVAKWIVIVFAVFAAIGILVSVVQFATGRSQFGIAVSLLLLVDVLYIAAATMLFRPDSRLWFGENPTDGERLA